jgi:hypothetical protein
LARLADSLSESTEQTLKDLTGEEFDMDLLQQQESPVDQASEDAAQEVDDAPVVKFIQKVLIDAINEGASDIHFEPYEKYYRIRVRTDGVLREVAQPPLILKEKIAARIKVISRLDISEKRIPQDGRMKLVLSKSKSIDFRVSSLPTLHGEKIVMRILDASSAMLGVAGRLGRLAVGEDGYPHVLAGARRQGDGAPHDLVGLAGVDPESDGQLDGLVEGGSAEAADQVDGLRRREQLVAVVALGGVVVLLALRHGGSLCGDGGRVRWSRSSPGGWLM